MLTRKQQELLLFIHERMKESGVPPSFDEMKDALDLASNVGIMVPERTTAWVLFGVVFLVFTLGLEFSLARMMAMRHEVFVIGGAQVAFTTAVLAGVLLLFQVPALVAVLIGGALAMSSTAIVVGQLAEQRRPADFLQDQGFCNKPTTRSRNAVQAADAGSISAKWSAPESSITSALSPVAVARAA